MTGSGRIQLNFELEPVPRIEVMANLPKMLFPWIWFEEGAEVPQHLVNLLKYTLILLDTFISHTHSVPFIH